MKELDLSKVTLQDIKKESITENQLDNMKNICGSYEQLFSRQAIKYKSLGLKDKVLNENDYKNFILDEYTFLKRPVLVLNNNIAIGNSKQSVERMKQMLNE